MTQHTTTNTTAPTAAPARAPITMTKRRRLVLAAVPPDWGSVPEITARLKSCGHDVPEGTVSSAMHHLAKAGLVELRKIGRACRYRQLHSTDAPAPAPAEQADLWRPMTGAEARALSRDLQDVAAAVHQLVQALQGGEH